MNRRGSKRRDINLCTEIPFPMGAHFTIHHLIFHHKFTSCFHSHAPLSLSLLIFFIHCALFASKIYKLTRIKLIDSVNQSRRRGLLPHNQFIIVARMSDWKFHFAFTREPSSLKFVFCVNAGLFLRPRFRFRVKSFTDSNYNCLCPVHFHPVWNLVVNVSCFLGEVQSRWFPCNNVFGCFQQGKRFVHRGRFCFHCDCAPSFVLCQYFPFWGNIAKASTSTHTIRQLTLLRLLLLFTEKRWYDITQ